MKQNRTLIWVLIWILTLVGTFLLAYWALIAFLGQYSQGV